MLLLSTFSPINFSFQHSVGKVKSSIKMKISSSKNNSIYVRLLHPRKKKLKVKVLYEELYEYDTHFIYNVRVHAFAVLSSTKGKSITS